MNLFLRPARNEDATFFTDEATFEPRVSREDKPVVITVVSVVVMLVLVLMLVDFWNENHCAGH